MNSHNGIRPQDIVILAKILALRESDWMMKDLASSLSISAGEVSESLKRSAYSGLLSADKKRVMPTAFLEFAIHGLRYVFPTKPGAMTRGMLTAFSGPALSGHILSEQKIVWPYVVGSDLGFAIEPLYPGVPEACEKDATFYELMSLIEALRIGKARERQLAAEILENRFYEKH